MAVSGSTMILDIDGTLVSCETDSNLNRTRDSIETTCKDSGSSKTFISGEMGATIDVTAVYSQSPAFGFDEANTAFDAGTEIVFKFGSTVATETYYTGSAIFSDISLANPQNDKSTWTATLQVTGAITTAVNS